MIPNFFIVGEAKTGTTALYFMLLQHPGVFMPRLKEPEFFCTDFHQESDRFHGRPRHFPIRRMDQYQGLFKDAGRSVAVGESSVNYLLSSAAAGNIHRFNPEARILVMLREPVALLQSFHSQLVFNLAEDILDFGEAMAAEEERRKGNRIPRSSRLPLELFYSERARFADHLRRYLDIFAPGKVKIIIHDDFLEAPLGVYRDVLDFLGVEPGFQPRMAAANSYKTVRHRRLKLLVQHPAVYETARKILPSRLYWKLKSLSYPFFSKKAPKPPLDPRLRQCLMQRFRPEVARLGELLDRDLISLWNYDRVL